MSDIEMRIKLERDSDNSYPSSAEVRLDGNTLRIDLSGPDRTIAFNLKRAIACLEDSE